MKLGNMSGFAMLPVELLDLIIEQVLTSVGIQKAIFLRIVSHAFDKAIVRAICVSQVVDVDDPATPRLAWRITSPLKGKTIAEKSRSADTTRTGHVCAVAKVNRALDSFLRGHDLTLTKSHQESIAGAVLINRVDHLDARIELQNALSGAALIGDLDIVEALLEGHSSVDVNGFTPYFYSPLTLAAAQGHITIVQHLLDRGARLDSTSHYWRKLSRLDDHSNWINVNEHSRRLALFSRQPSALCTAVSGGHEDIVQLLLRPEHRLATTSLEYLRAILEGARVGRLDLINVLFKTMRKCMSDFPGLGSELLWAATRCNQKEVVQMLINSGVDINAIPRPDSGQDHGALQIAASLGNLEMVHFLLGRGARTDVKGSLSDSPLPIEEAARCGQEEVVQLLIENHGAEAAAALRSATMGSQPRLIKYLLDNFPDLPDRDEGAAGRGLLQIALTVGNLEAITLLVDAGVPLNPASDDPDELPLNLAKSCCGSWVVNYLLSLGAQETDVELVPYEEYRTSFREVRISERTWNWVGKY